MGRRYDRVIGSDDVEYGDLDRRQVCEQGRGRHEMDARCNVFGAGLLQLPPNILHCRNGAVILPWASLVEDTFDGAPAKLFAGGDPASEELAKQERTHAGYPQQLGRQALLSFETSAGEGPDQDDGLYQFRIVMRDQQGHEAARGVADQRDRPAAKVTADRVGIGGSH